MVSYSKLWKLLIDKKMKKVDLMRMAHISSNALSHLSKDEPVSIEVIGKICLALECTPNDVSHEEKEHLTVAGYALFPEVLSAGNNKKYNRYALWLATKKGVINTNIRDSFSAGGKVDMPTKGGILVKMPAAFGRIKRYKDLIEEIITEANANVLSEYWNADIQEDRLTQWCEMVAKEADTKNAIEYQAILI